MKYKKAVIKNTELKITESKDVDVGKIKSGCWAIQIEGIKACETCDLLNSSQCGGKQLRRAILKK